MPVDKEIASFHGLWENGYFDADPLLPAAESSYSRDDKAGYISVYHATYLYCIKQFVSRQTTALEIGPGRGAWTKCMKHAKEVYAIDAESAKNNKFWEYLGKSDNIKYIQVNDFECKELPDNHFDYMFSFGCLCHVSFPNITAYANNLYNKLVSGSECFWMIADYEQFERVGGRKIGPEGLLPDDEPRPGRWFNAGKQRTCEMLVKRGYRIVQEDIGTCLRDPIIHFVRP